METCCGSFVRYLMVLLTTTFTLLGGLLLGLGIWSQVYAKDYMNFLGPDYLLTPHLLIILGLLVLLVAALGCCGAWLGSRCLLRTFAVLLLALVLAQIGGGVAAVVARGSVKGAVRAAMVEGMANYDRPGFQGVTATWDTVQAELRCCGVEGPSDWSNVIQPVGNNTLLPPSCFKEGKVFPMGCFDLLALLLEDHLALLAGIALAVVVVELVVVLVACCIRGKAKAGRYESL